MLADWFHRLGVLGIPLLACSVLALALIVERLGFMLRARAIPAETLREALASIRAGRAQPYWASDRHAELRGTALLLRHRTLPKPLRDEVLGLFLQAEGERFHARLTLLRLIAAIAPMLGLLGTVVGMLVLFRAIAASTGPVHPALLAEGLSQAMLTTVFGLSIAIPTLTVAQCVKLWARGRMERLGRRLCELSLELETTRPEAPAPRAEAAE